jgi:hypothetical protein
MATDAMITMKVEKYVFDPFAIKLHMNDPWDVKKCIQG